MKTVSEPDRHLVEFAGLLRRVGIRISASEILDAAQGLALVGMEDRNRVEAVLAATLVKEPNQIPRFEEAFRAYFAPPDQKKAWQEEAEKKAAQWREDIGQTHEELRFQGRELALSEEERTVYARLPEEEKERLRSFLAKSSEGMKSGIPVDHAFQPILERTVRGSLEYWRHRLGEDFPLLPPGEANGVLSEVEEAIRRQELAYLSQDLKKIAPEDWPKVADLIRRLTERLAGQISRRYQADRRRGGIDMRRTLRANMRYGGVLLARRYRSRHRGRPKFVLLCDLSGSMVKYTEFVLQFIYGLSTVVSGIETFAFGERLARLTDEVRSGKSFQEMVREALPAAGENWGGGTNLAVALEELVHTQAQVLTRRTVFIILSDSQTLEGERAAQYLALIRRRVREILWLNTLPERRWPEIKTIEQFQSHCRMYECYTLGHLTGILSERLG
ncbi:von Willebrand factor, type A [Acididesulfobacillus acetoxydans]|uniref:VWA containing CoxE protein n=1 Tax=Acididesulfobacillus acetoxydans TaxID=1561005 RepID=A0A8S0W9V6_9FIRM|nr:VWA domain-containing protein [Acididesulfobacillus acetoxydans]CAA7602919.1 von Willebrand factor, type A [Acididesulfobacillus acetoxydans]CEJ05801.1 VWA containing CoxE protein [Acididesulfobacillus acetoxydans]